MPHESSPKPPWPDVPRVGRLTVTEHTETMIADPQILVLELQMTPEALFKFRIVSAVAFLQSQGHGRTDAVRLVAAQMHTELRGTVRRISEATVWRWLKTFEEHGLDGLESKPRQVREDSVLSLEFRQFVRVERALDARASIPEIINRARASGVIHPDETICRSTVHRWMVREKIPVRPVRFLSDADTRRWSYPDRLQLVMLDFVHFRAGFPSPRKRCAIYVIDDATRKTLGCRVTTSENADTALWVLSDVLGRYGRFDGVYCDQGPAFIAHDVALALANLGIPLIWGTTAYPQGRGKIERFNRSLKARMLGGLRRPEVDADCGALTLRCGHDAFEVYNHLEHSEIKRSPEAAWRASTRELRPIEEHERVRAFTIVEERLVSADHVLQFGGLNWEVPRGIAPRQKVAVHRRLLEDDALYVELRGELVRLHEVDLAHNATSRRSSAPEPEPDDESVPTPRTASMMAFEKAFTPMTGPDGGYPDIPDEEE